MVAIRLYRLYRSYGFTKVISITRALQMLQGSTSCSYKPTITKKAGL
jgi:hypothetical protein